MDGPGCHQCAQTPVPGRTRSNFTLQPKEPSSPTLVQKQHAPVGDFKASLFLRNRSGEGASFVAKELALQKVFGNRRAVNGDEWLVGARTLAEQWLGPRPVPFPFRFRRR